MARSSLSWKYERDGPFFVGDPRKTFRKNVRAFMDEIAELGERDVKAAMRAGESSRRPMRGIEPSRVSAHVVGRTSAHTGKRWALTAVVGVPNAGWSKVQGTTLMAAASEVESQTRVFKKVTSRIRRARTDLLRGLR